VEFAKAAVAPMTENAPARPPRGGTGLSILFVIFDVVAADHVILSNNAFDENESEGQDGEREKKTIATIEEWSTPDLIDERRQSTGFSTSFSHSAAISRRRLRDS
jgi:hypothetical protein